VLTDRTPTAILAIPTSAVVEANGKKLVYIQNGNAYQSVEVTLGQTSGDMVEVKTGLFEGDLIVTQRAPQLFPQSLRGGVRKAKVKRQKAKVKRTILRAKIPSSKSTILSRQLKHSPMKPARVLNRPRIQLSCHNLTLGRLVNCLS
jgi:membrane fusion protein, heavy metal efflux system